MLDTEVTLPRLFLDERWRKTLEAYRRSISAEDFEHVKRCATLDNCRLSAKLVHRKLAGNAEEQLQPFFKRLSALVNVIALFVSTQPGAVGLVYGAFSLVLEVSEQVIQRK